MVNNLTGSSTAIRLPAASSTWIGIKSILPLPLQTRVAFIFTPGILKGIKFLDSASMKAENLCCHGKAKEKDNSLIQRT